MTRIVVDVPDSPESRRLLDQLSGLGARQRPARTLVIGGARSGKSSYAEALLGSFDHVDYIATSQRNPDDPEWMARIAAHVARRPKSWNTVETLDVAQVLSDDGSPALVDCLGVWLTRELDVTDAWQHPEQARPELQHRIDELATAVAGSPRRVVLVTNEVGSGVVPATQAGRTFRDWLGILNASVADACDEVLLCVAGRALSLPPRPGGPHGAGTDPQPKDAI
ncbi:bifunctional adenosylcobinamide kinase/adenosylcobinamide-phosphate guanylyltransferase [Propionibacterium freudenreichii]|uniref:bifunctional adenosylcobinamide kinase/adenosylcobinamide-phosphate guanylyltransferase n=1 Tax=Propionibacterium freudenreichii TaxID=1744 RepID=UPI000543FBB8|nr:bifunctional adenosylcobinamide kinase/adenosylcobinamide-phosphate guanylyltransferase [Propionibacterium freudenreichii]MCT3017787.1 bifunctional adenosylcobinamide kinase/adenosylcobinamide-phosphate guanylyltransferase [Propionibacterium freudenreichii]MDK9641331.1 bifunctional adenosylcobinamide kinase/adenosylcobinamide-phosphate guanylyltransferase [Propionibacterium freudenreichii]CEG87664.1 CobU Bifunctional cobalamin biosynthesis pyrophosphate enzyme [Propionibacterium freudenreichi